MTNWYLSSEESAWLKANGGKERLKALVQQAMNVGADGPGLTHCPKCGRRKKRPPYDEVCWNCGEKLV